MQAANSEADTSLSSRLGTVLQSFVPGLSTMEDPIIQMEGSSVQQETEEVVINMEQDTTATSNSNTGAAPGPRTGAAPGPTTGATGEEVAGGQHNGGLLDMRMMRALSDNKIIIFLVILSAKILYDHSLGMLVFIGLTGTFCHHNGTLKRQVSLKDKRRIPMLLLMLVMLIFSSYFVYFVFEEQELYKCLFFLKPNLEIFDLWAVVWCTGVTDYILKFFTICCKCLVALIPNIILSCKRKGRVFRLVEQVSQLYRALPPVPLWVVYFNQDFDSQWLVGYIFTGAYMITKFNLLYGKAQELKVAVSQLLAEVRYGIAPSKDQVHKTGDACPICQDNFTNPIQLHCKHIFCEDCVGLWFDRERTCPMCRAKVADDPTWRDGSTSLFVQFF